MCALHLKELHLKEWQAYMHIACGNGVARVLVGHSRRTIPSSPLTTSTHTPRRSAKLETLGNSALQSLDALLLILLCLLPEMFVQFEPEACFGTGMTLAAV